MKNDYIKSLLDFFAVKFKIFGKSFQDVWLDRSLYESITHMN